MVYFIHRSDEEIDKQLNLAAEHIDEGITLYKGMTYEEGVRDSINWLMGTQDDLPLEKD